MSTKDDNTLPYKTIYEHTEKLTDLELNLRGLSERIALSKRQPLTELEQARFLRAIGNHVSNVVHDIEHYVLHVEQECDELRAENQELRSKISRMQEELFQLEVDGPWK